MLKKAVLALLFVALIGMVGCTVAPPPSTDGAQVQQPAANNPASPTNTPVPPTNTPVPTNTPTPVPTPTFTPEPDLKTMMQQKGYSATDPLLKEGFEIGNLLKVQTSSSFKKDPNQFVHAITFPLPSEVELAGFNMEIGNPNVTLSAVVMALNGVGIEAKADLTGGQIGEMSKGVTFVTNIGGTNYQVNVVLFRRGSTGAIVMVMGPQGDTAGSDVYQVAAKLDKELTK